jgi:hypothetical protein
VAEQANAAVDSFGFHGEVEPVHRGGVGDVVGVDMAVADRQGALGLVGPGHRCRGRGGV